MRKQIILLPLMLLMLLMLLAPTASASINGYQVASGSLSTGASTGNVSVTSLTFTPKVLLMRFNVQAAANTTGTGAAIGWGAAISSSNRATNYTRRTSATTTTNSTHDATKIVLTHAAGVTNLAIDFVSFNSNGFTLNVVTSPGSNVLLFWLALGGDDLKANLIQFDSRTTTGSTGHTGMGFKPDVLFVFTSGMTAAIPTTDGNSRPGYGWVDSALNQGALGVKQVTGANTSRKAQSAANAIYIPDTSAMWLAGAVTSLDADGFTMNYTTVQGSAIHLWALGLSGIRSKVSTLNQATASPPATQAVTAVGYTPKHISIGSFCSATVSGQQNNGTMSLGFAAGGAQSNNSYASTTGGNNLGLANFDNQIVACYTGGTPTLDTQSAFTSFDAQGFTLTTGTVNGTAMEMIYAVTAPLPVNKSAMF
jgi:hypothetical protein